MNDPKSNDPFPYVLPPSLGLPGFDESVKASIASTGGHLSVIESRTSGGAPWHVHTREDEYFYVTKGNIIVYQGKEVFEAGPGSFVFLPRNIPHAWDVVGEEATLLMMTVPAMLGEFLAELHQASTREGRDSVGAKYGIQFFWNAEHLNMP